MMLIRIQRLDPYNTVDSTTALQALRLALTNDGCNWLSLLIWQMRHQILGVIISLSLIFQGFRVMAFICIFNHCILTM